MTLTPELVMTRYGCGIRKALRVMRAAGGYAIGARARDIRIDEETLIAWERRASNGASGGGVATFTLGTLSRASARRRASVIRKPLKVGELSESDLRQIPLTQPRNRRASGSGS